MIFLISFNYKKLDFPCFFSKKYAMINVVLINNLFFSGKKSIPSRVEVLNVGEVVVDVERGMEGVV